MVDDASWRLTIQRGDLVDAFPVFIEAWSKSAVRRWHAQSVDSLIDFALNEVKCSVLVTYLMQALGMWLRMPRRAVYMRADASPPRNSSITNFLFKSILDFE